MPNNFANQPRITIDGKFFRLGAEKFFVKGVSYGPFAPNGEMEMFPSREQAGRDFRQLQQLGVNLLRVYYVPPKWFLELAADFSIKLLIDIPWPSHLCFLESEEPQEQAREAVRSAALHCKDHSAVFALSVANEIPAETVRWTGVKRVGAFIEELIGIVKSIDSNLLCTGALVSSHRIPDCFQQRFHKLQCLFASGGGFSEVRWPACKCWRMQSLWFWPKWGWIQYVKESKDRLMC